MHPMGSVNFERNENCKPLVRFRLTNAARSMKIHWLLFVFILNRPTLFGQTKEDCRQILKKEITLKKVQENFPQFVADFETLLHCDFDSIDYQIFMGPEGKMPMVMQSVLEIGLKPDKFTYLDLKKKLLDLRQQPEYFQIRKIVELKNELIQRVASTRDWNSDKQLLVEMGLSEPHLADIYSIVKENESSSYSVIFSIYSDTLQARKERFAALKELNDATLMLENPEMVEWIKGLFAYTDYEIGLRRSVELKKPVLLYFNGYGSANSRKIESEILENEEIQTFINNKLIFVSLLVDERVKLADSAVYHSEILNREITTTGQKRLEMEIREFNSDLQPLFVLLDLNGKEISRISYTNDLKEFELFIKTIEK